MKAQSIQHSPDDPLPRAALIKIPRQPRSVEMVHNILDAGMLVIRKDGLAAMTTNRVAEQAGISIGSLYQYFANRDSILAGIIERSQLDISQRMQQMQASQLDMPLELLIRGGLRLMLRYYEPHMTVVKRVIQEVPLLADNSVLRVMETTLMNLVRDYLLSNSHRYRLRTGHAGLYVAINTLMFMYLKWLSQPHPLVSEEQFVEALSQQVLSCVEVLEQGGTG